jgi:hypothetical protein
MEKITAKTAMQFLLVMGTILLMSLGVNGWGWLIFLLFVFS